MAQDTGTGEIKIIGVSAQSPHDISITTDKVSRIFGYPIGDFDNVILDFMENLLNMRLEKGSDDMTAYLGREWSYVREEKFNENGKIVFKPVRYHLTPKQIFTKLKYDLRDIHSDIWVNCYFNQCSLPIVLPVIYPNQADAIIERGGIVIRADNSFYRPANKEEQLMDNYECTYRVSTDDGLSQLEKLLWRIKNEK